MLSNLKVVLCCLLACVTSHCLDTASLETDPEMTALVLLAANSNLTNTVGNWTDFTLSINATSVAPAKGSVFIDSARWRRVGQSMEIMYTYGQTGAGSAGTGTYLFPLPASYTIDSTKAEISTSAPGSVLGTAGLRSGANFTVGYPIAYTTTALALLHDNGAGTALFVSSTSLPLSAAVVAYTFEATVPISGW